MLERRRKYKCAKCGKLWKQAGIETKEFVKMNKREREKLKKEIRKEIRLEYRQNNPEKAKESSRKYYQKNKRKIIEKYKETRKRYRERNKEKLKKQMKKYYDEHRDALVAKSRAHWQKVKEERNTLRRAKDVQAKNVENEKRQSRRNSNIEDTRLNLRIGYWRQQQKELALQSFDIAHQNAWGMQIREILHIPNY